ncbi:Crp/Fnr family transcriptional regulator [Brevibacillus sp. B_LB10_24]|uniref:Crp/Fnr family transcriptional regulator n=1 Tax=Brevibacillus sp. B_LB10_24 TaxID=3380645 RepID=UPI0038BAF17F
MTEPRSSSNELHAFLKRVPLLDGIDDSSLAVLAANCRIKHVPKDNIIFSQGDPADAVYIVRSGSVAEYFSGSNDLEIVVKKRCEGDYFGEMGMLIEEPHLVTAIASQPSSLVTIPRDQFLLLLRSELGLMQYLLKTLVQRLKISGERLVALTLMDANTYLAYRILSLEQEEGGRGSLSVSQEYLAQRCGLARQTVARILGEWRRAGWIITQRGKIEIIDRTALSLISYRHLPDQTEIQKMGASK